MQYSSMALLLILICTSLRFSEAFPVLYRSSKRTGHADRYGVSILPTYFTSQLPIMFDIVNDATSFDRNDHKKTCISCQNSLVVLEESIKEQEANSPRHNIYPVSTHFSLESAKLTTVPFGIETKYLNTIPMSAIDSTELLGSQKEKYTHLLPQGATEKSATKGHHFSTHYPSNEQQNLKMDIYSTTEDTLSRYTSSSTVGYSNTLEPVEEETTVLQIENPTKIEGDKKPHSSHVASMNYGYSLDMESVTSGNITKHTCSKNSELRRYDEVLYPNFQTTNYNTRNTARGIERKVHSQITSNLGVAVTKNKPSPTPHLIHQGVQTNPLESFTFKIAWNEIYDKKLKKPNDEEKMSLISQEYNIKTIYRNKSIKRIETKQLAEADGSIIMTTAQPSSHLVTVNIGKYARTNSNPIQLSTATAKNEQVYITTSMLDHAKESHLGLSGTSFQRSTIPANEGYITKYNEPCLSTSNTVIQTAEKKSPHEHYKKMENIGPSHFTLVDRDQQKNNEYGENKLRTEKLETSLNTNNNGEERAEAMELEDNATIPMTQGLQISRDQKYLRIKFRCLNKNRTDIDARRRFPSTFSPEQGRKDLKTQQRGKPAPNTRNEDLEKFEILEHEEETDPALTGCSSGSPEISTTKQTGKIYNAEMVQRGIQSIRIASNRFYDRDINRNGDERQNSTLELRRKEEYQHHSERKEFEERCKPGNFNSMLRSKDGSRKKKGQKETKTLVSEEAKKSKFVKMMITKQKHSVIRGETEKSNKTQNVKNFKLSGRVIQFNGTELVFNLTKRRNEKQQKYTVATEEQRKIYYNEDKKSSMLLGIMSTFRETMKHRLLNNVLRDISTSETPINVTDRKKMQEKKAVKKTGKARDGIEISTTEERYGADKANFTSKFNLSRHVRDQRWQHHMNIYKNNQQNYKQIDTISGIGYQDSTLINFKHRGRQKNRSYAELSTATKRITEKKKKHTLKYLARRKTIRGGGQVSNQKSCKQKEGNGNDILGNGQMTDFPAKREHTSTNGKTEEEIRNGWLILRLNQQRRQIKHKNEDRRNLSPNVSSHLTKVNKQKRNMNILPTPGGTSYPRKISKVLKEEKPTKLTETKQTYPFFSITKDYNLSKENLMARSELPTPTTAFYFRKIHKIPEKDRFSGLTPEMLNTTLFVKRKKRVKIWPREITTLFIPITFPYQDNFSKVPDQKKATSLAPAMPKSKKFLNKQHWSRKNKLSEKTMDLFLPTIPSYQNRFYNAWKRKKLSKFSTTMTIPLLFTESTEQTFRKEQASEAKKFINPITNIYESRFSKRPKVGNPSRFAVTKPKLIWFSIEDGYKIGVETNKSTSLPLNTLNSRRLTNMQNWAPKKEWPERTTNLFISPSYQNRYDEQQRINLTRFPLKWQKPNLFTMSKAGDIISPVSKTYQSRFSESPKEKESDKFAVTKPMSTWFTILRGNKLSTETSKSTSLDFTALNRRHFQNIQRRYRPEKITDFLMTATATYQRYPDRLQRENFRILPLKLPKPNSYTISEARELISPVTSNHHTRFRKIPKLRKFTKFAATKPMVPKRTEFTNLVSTIPIPMTAIKRKKPKLNVVSSRNKTTSPSPITIFHRSKSDRFPDGKKLFQTDTTGLFYPTTVSYEKKLLKVPKKMPFPGLVPTTPIPVAAIERKKPKLNAGSPRNKTASPVPITIFHRNKSDRFPDGKKSLQTGITSHMQRMFTKWKDHLSKESPAKAMNPFITTSRYYTTNFPELSRQNNTQRPFTTILNLAMFKKRYGPETAKEMTDGITGLIGRTEKSNQRKQHTASPNVAKFNYEKAHNKESKYRPVIVIPNLTVFRKLYGKERTKDMTTQTPELFNPVPHFYQTNEEVTETHRKLTSNSVTNPVFAIFSKRKEKKLRRKRPLTTSAPTTDSPETMVRQIPKQNIVTQYPETSEHRMFHQQVTRKKPKCAVQDKADMLTTSLMTEETTTEENVERITLRFGLWTEASPKAWIATLYLKPVSRESTDFTLPTYEIYTSPTKSTHSAPSTHKITSSTRYDVQSSSKKMSSVSSSLTSNGTSISSTKSTLSTPLSHNITSSIPHDHSSSTKTSSISSSLTSHGVSITFSKSTHSAPSTDKVPSLTYNNGHSSSTKTSPISITSHGISISPSKSTRSTHSTHNKTASIHHHVQPSPTKTSAISITSHGTSISPSKSTSSTSSTHKITSSTRHDVQSSSKKATSISSSLTSHGISIPSSKLTLSTPSFQKVTSSLYHDIHYSTKNMSSISSSLTSPSKSKSSLSSIHKITSSTPHGAHFSSTMKSSISLSLISHGVSISPTKSTRSTSSTHKETSFTRHDVHPSPTKASSISRSSSKSTRSSPATHIISTSTRHDAHSSSIYASSGSNSLASHGISTSSLQSTPATSLSHKITSSVSLYGTQKVSDSVWVNRTSLYSGTMSSTLEVPHHAVENVAGTSSTLSSGEVLWTSTSCHPLPTGGLNYIKQRTCKRMVNTSAGYTSRCSLPVPPLTLRRTLRRRLRTTPAAT